MNNARLKTNALHFFSSHFTKSGSRIHHFVLLKKKILCSEMQDPKLARRKKSRKVTERNSCLRIVVIMGLLSISVSLVCMVALERIRIPEVAKAVRRTTRISFGSSTSMDYRSQPIWVKGIIPSNPDAWIWIGDMAYMDRPRINCQDMPWHEQCNCTNTWLHQANISCMAGNVEYASSRMEVQLANPDYAQFLAFMCPGHRAKGLHPPNGSDSSICPRRILGTYGGHDYGWEHGDKRLPQKDQIKQIFLNALGEPKNSSRRDLGHGIQWKYTLNSGKQDEAIDIYLLDEHYYRDSLPCHVRKEFCQNVATIGQRHPKYAWCMDFIHGGEYNNGSCCGKDEEIFYGWCLQPGNKGHRSWQSLCNPISAEFGELSGNATSFCEILGGEQRKWLEKDILQSKAPLKLIVSSSLVIGNPMKRICEDLGNNQEVECPCSGNDWECYKPAQLQFLNLISQAPGCVVLVTGGLEYSDIKVLKPRADYIKKHYGGIEFSYPLYQIMASGLTAKKDRNFSCDILRRDPLKLRDHPECDFVRAPSFGMVEVDWGRVPVVKIQIRDGMTGTVRVESTLKIVHCLQRDWSRKHPW